MSSAFYRRDILKILSASVLAGPLQLTAAEADKPLYFSKDEFALLDSLTEHIIPRDAHSPGAHDAGVAAFIDRSVAEAFLPEEKQAWNKGLAEMNRLSLENNDRPFLKAHKDAQIALLTKLAQGESNPKTDGEKFFRQLKESTVFAYYTSDIGIHKDMEYKGNTIQEQFSGYDAL
jgi:gluconate 2-dehydrogenase subunit 3-like protein